jgi:hypothetical protein
LSSGLYLIRIQSEKEVTSQKILIKRWLSLTLHTWQASYRQPAGMLGVVVHTKKN